MTDRQQRFVTEYLIDLNATAAAERAGYAHPNVQGPRMLVNVSVHEAIAERQKRHFEQADLCATRVLEEFRRLAFVDVRRCFDERGNLLPIRQLPDEVAACIAGFEVIKKNAEAGDDKIDTVHKIKLWDKTKILELLARHFRLIEPAKQEQPKPAISIEVKNLAFVLSPEELQAVKQRLEDKKPELVQ